MISNHFGAPASRTPFWYFLYEVLIVFFKHVRNGYHLTLIRLPFCVHSAFMLRLFGSHSACSALIPCSLCVRSAFIRIPFCTYLSFTGLSFCFLASLSGYSEFFVHPFCINLAFIPCSFCPSWQFIRLWSGADPTLSLRSFCVPSERILRSFGIHSALISNHSAFIRRSSCIHSVFYSVFNLRSFFVYAARILRSFSVHAARILRSFVFLPVSFYAHSELIRCSFSDV